MRVLVPRGGPWGERVVALLERRGASAVIAPLIDFAPPLDEAALSSALRELADGEFDWLVVTSATTVDVLGRIAARTRIAAVGTATEAALGAAGYPVAFVPFDNSSSGLIAELPVPRGRTLVLQSSLASARLANELGAERVAAYRPIELAIEDRLRDAVTADQIDAILVTSGSIARAVVAQFGVQPRSVVIACIGPETALAAREAGLRVDLVAPNRTLESLVETLVGGV